MIMTGYPTADVLPSQVQGPAVQGMFLHLLEQVDPEVVKRLHANNRYRPYTLSPLGIGDTPPYTPLKGGITPASSQKGNTQSQERNTPPDAPLKGGIISASSQEGNVRREFRGFRLPPEKILSQGTPCYLRVTLLEDDLFPTFARYFLSRPEPTFRLGPTEFVVTSVVADSASGNSWARYASYPDLIDQVRQAPLQHHITLHFVTPLSFSRGDIDLPLPVPRLVFQSYLKRFQEFSDFPFLPDFVELADSQIGISKMEKMRTGTIKTKRVMLSGFTGEVKFTISKKASKEFVFQTTLLAEFAFFCGTGKKTTVGMGQTIRVRKNYQDFP
jgi:CRISPR-associated endoribonuclease Cas6